jgi:hypothetical protein
MKFTLVKTGFPRAPCPMNLERDPRDLTKEWIGVRKPLAHSVGRSCAGDSFGKSTVGMLVDHRGSAELR